MPHVQLSSEFLQYLASHQSGANGESGDNDRLPSLNEMSKELGVSVALLREQLEVAKAIGLVEVRPRTGIRRLPYTFLPAVRQSLSYAVTVSPDLFAAFADLRNHIEAAYWDEAARALTVDDQERLNALMGRAWEKLNSPMAQIPHEEHKLLHLMIFSRLGNPFVLGLLEAYWEAYETVGLNMYTELDYLRQVWTYHQEMVDAICAGDFDRGYQALTEHKDLLFHRHSGK